jgi:hypothetical protein
MKRLSFWFSGLAVAAGLAVSTAQAQYYLRSDFNSWGTMPLVDNNNGTFSATFTGGTPGANLDFKIATADWSSAYPGSNERAVFDSAGNFTVNFIPSPAADGWSPTGARVGYVDPQQFSWDVIGSFNSWASPVVSLTSMGNGLYAGDYLITSAGAYEFKFREAGSWNISIGNDFGNSADNATVNALLAGDTLHFQLDLPNGRWQVSEVPEPGLLALAAAGAAMLLVRRPRKQG